MSGAYVICGPPKGCICPAVAWSCVCQPCRSGHADCTVDCGWCKGKGRHRKPPSADSTQSGGTS